MDQNSDLTFVWKLQDEIAALRERAEAVEARLKPFLTLFPGGSPEPLCGRSWGGFNLCGDRKSIDEVVRLDCKAARVDAIADRLKAAEERLRVLEPYARAGLNLLDVFWEHECGDMDGGDIQAGLEKAGVIVNVPYDPAVHGTGWGEEWGTLPGDDYATAPGRAAARAALGDRP